MFQFGPEINIKVENSGKLANLLAEMRKHAQGEEIFTNLGERLNHLADKPRSIAWSRITTTLHS